MPLSRTGADRTPEWEHRLRSVRRAVTTPEHPIAAAPVTYRRGKTYRRLVLEEAAAALIWALVFAGVMFVMK